VEHRQPLLEPVDALADRAQLDAVCRVLVELPARAHAEHQPPAAEVVQGGGDVREHRGMAVGHGGDQAAETHPRYGGGEPGEEREALVQVLVRALLGAGVAHEVVGDPEPVVPGGLGLAGDGDGVLGGPGGAQPGADGEIGHWSASVGGSTSAVMMPPPREGVRRRS
jgi:hypothetical protein